MITNAKFVVTFNIDTQHSMWYLQQQNMEWPVPKPIAKPMNTLSTWDPCEWEIHTSVERDVPSISRIASSSKQCCFFSLVLSGASKSSNFLRHMEVAILDSEHDGSIVDDKDYEIVIMSTTTIISFTLAMS